MFFFVWLFLNFCTETFCLRFLFNLYNKYKKIEIKIQIQVCKKIKMEQLMINLKKLKDINAFKQNKVIKE